MRIVILFLCLLQSAHACQICLPYPEDTILDRINESESIVLARENPKKPFHLSPIEILRGDAVEFDLYLPSPTKRLLKLYPNRSIACGYIDDEWQQIFEYEPQLRSLLNILIANEWGEDKTVRAQFFAKYLTDRNSTIQRLAHVEVARAPYANIRSLQHSIPKDYLLSFLGDQRMLEWHSLYILLLAQMADEQDKVGIQKRFEILAEYRLTTQLAAWTLAYLETGKSAALESITNSYFHAKDRSTEEIREVIGALGTYASVARKKEIINIFISLLKEQPQLLPELFPWFNQWQAYESAEAISESLKLSHDILTTTQAKVFLRKAQSLSLSDSNTKAEVQTNPAITYLVLGAFATLTLLALFKAKKLRS